MKRFLSVLLAAALLLGLTAPVRGAGLPRDRETDSWAAIRAIEALAASENGPLSQAQLAALYEDRVDQMIPAVRNAPDYRAGSLERHGNFFFWETTDGRANGYSPSLRAELRSAVDAPVQKAAADLPPLSPGEGDNTGESRDVGVFIPYSGSYYFYAETCIAEGRELARSTGGALHVYTAENTTVDTLAEALETCGLLLINSHGRTDYEGLYDQTSRANSSYVCLPTDEGVTVEDQQAVTGQFGTYYHAFYAGPSEDFDEEYYCVDGTCIANHMNGRAPHSMVWLGLCLGMATEGLFAPLRDKGVEAMIGFSESVTTNADHEYRAVLVNTLLRDSTLGEAAAAMKEQVGCPDPYQTAHVPAWPIAVSSQDPYPGRSHLTEGQEVLSTWKLHPAYPIAVTVEPEGSAEVVVTRAEAAITPHRGFTFEDWEITEGEVTAVRDGDLLHFDLSGPCAVTLHMQARTPAAVQFTAGPGQSAPEINEFLGDTVLLPEPEGALEADVYLYHFLGWTADAPEADSPELPSLLHAGDRLKLTRPETILRAVYGYFAADDGVSAGQFRLVTEAPEDWTGDYVLTYQSTKALRASSQVTGHSIITPFAVASDTAAGYFVDGIWLNEVPEELVYSFLPKEDGAGPLKMKTSENYLAVPSSNVLLTTVTDPTGVGVDWRMDCSEGTVTVKNNRFPARMLQFSLTSSGFCTLTTMRGPLTLYARVPGQHLYTTRPQMRQTLPELPCTGEETCPSRCFADAPARGHWAHDAIDWAVVSGITTGRTPASFGPRAACTRAQIVTFLWRAAGSPEPQTEERPFRDVRPGSYYEQAVLWAWEQGITLGTGNVLFSPQSGCTREQAVTFLWRFAGQPAPGDTDCAFTDVSADSYARPAILWASACGITTGTDETHFSPGIICTRAQIVTFLWRAAVR